MCRLKTPVTAAALCSSCSLQKNLERWPAAFSEAELSVLMLMKRSKIPRIELNTVHLYQHYSLFIPNKPQYTWCGDYCECMRPGQIPVVTEVRVSSLLEQHPRYVPPPGSRRIQQRILKKCKLQKNLFIFLQIINLVGTLEEFTGTAFWSNSRKTEI